jgi:hypothetical protein
MNNFDTTLEIRTLGRFSISIDGKQVATEWPNETIKVFFCSLLSPLDVYFTWDRICRSILGVPVTQTNRNRLEEIVIRPLNSFLIKEIGFSPLITEHVGIRINQKRINVDACDFHKTVIEGHRLLFHDNYAAAIAKFSRADSLYTGSYLPGITGNTIDSTRNDLELLYRTAVKDVIPLIMNVGYSGWNNMAEPEMYLMAA